MKEKRIIIFTLVLALTLLAEAFILLFAYVSSEWANMSTDIINPVRTVIATSVMILAGVVVYIKRNKKK